MTMTTREEHRAEIDRRSDEIRDQIEAGDWQAVRQFLADAPEAQQREFYTQCVRVMLSRGADFMSGPMRTVAAPLQEAVALGIAERVDREMQP
jgi:hypothetical protein